MPLWLEGYDGQNINMIWKRQFEFHSNSLETFPNQVMRFPF